MQLTAPIDESSNSRRDAIVAAPVQKLCPEKPSGLKPASDNASRSLITSMGQVSALPEANVNNGPG